MEHVEEKPYKPFDNLEASFFNDFVRSMQEMMVKRTTHCMSQRMALRAAMGLVVKGGRDYDSLGVITVDEIDEWFKDGPTKTALRSLAKDACKELDIKHRKQAAEYEMMREFRPKNYANALLIVAAISPEAIQSLQAAHAQHVKAVHGGTQTLRPSTAIRQMAQAAKQGEDIATLLETQKKLMVEANRMDSLKSACAALRNWHVFAHEIKGIPDEATLPPVNEAHVCDYVSTFTNSGTCSDCVGALRFICTFPRAGHDMGWTNVGPDDGWL